MVPLVGGRRRRDSRRQLAFLAGRPPSPLVADGHVELGVPTGTTRRKLHSTRFQHRRVLEGGRPRQHGKRENDDPPSDHTRECDPHSPRSRRSRTVCYLYLYVLDLRISFRTSVGILTENQLIYTHALGQGPPPVVPTSRGVLAARAAGGDARVRGAPQRACTALSAPPLSLLSSCYLVATTCHGAFCTARCYHLSSSLSLAHSLATLPPGHSSHFGVPSPPPCTTGGPSRCRRQRAGVTAL